MQIVMAMYLLICFITYAHKMILWDFLGEKIWVSSNIGLHGYNLSTKENWASARQN